MATAAACGHRRRLYVTHPLAYSRNPLAKRAHASAYSCQVYLKVVSSRKKAKTTRKSTTLEGEASASGQLRVDFARQEARLDESRRELRERHECVRRVLEKAARGEHIDGVERRGSGGVCGDGCRTRLFGERRERRALERWLQLGHRGILLVIQFEKAEAL